jgi:hypothetical protein
MSAAPNFFERPFDHQEVADAWSAVAEEAPHIIEHITGTVLHAHVALDRCVSAFHAAAILEKIPLTPQRLAAALTHFPEGAFAQRAGTKTFAKDVCDLWAECIERAKEKIEIAKIQFFDPWADPPPPEFPGGVLPRDMEDAVFALALRDGVCPGALAMAYLAAVSGAAHKGSRFKPYQTSDWCVPPIVWVMVIADSGQRKTAIEDRAFAGLRSAHTDVWRVHRDRLRQWNALPAKDRRDTQKPEEPHCFIVEDVTPEKLQAILAANDRGTFMLRDEMAGLLEFGRYTQGKGGSERAFYLQAYEAGVYTVSRLSRDSIHIAVNGITIYGSIQPDRLADFPDLAKDGFMQRMNTIRASQSSSSRPDIAVSGLDRISAAIQALTHRGPRRYHTDAAGAKLIHETEVLGRKLVSVSDFGPGFQGTCSKLHGTHARYALLLHLLDAPDEPCIPAATVERASRLIHQFLLPQARDFFAGLTGSPERLQQDVAGWILTKAKPRFLASDVSTGIWAMRGMKGRDIFDALEPFVAGNWITPETEFPTNRAWQLHPHLRTAKAKDVETQRARREEARQIVAGIGASRNPENPDGNGAVHM